MKSLFCTWFVLVICLSACSQQRMNIHFRKNLYDKSIRAALDENKQFESYYLITPGYFDKNGDNEIEVELLERTLTAWFPDKNDDSYLVIDWEKQYFKDLKDELASSPAFLKAKNGFIELIEHIRIIRPNLKLAIYGVPYRFNYDFQRVKDNQKFDSLLLHCDFIAPSLYIPFEEPRNSSRNKSFLANNLKDAIEISLRIDKPVIPFVWYMYSGAFENTQGRFISKDIMLGHLDFIQSYRHRNSGISGVLWWDPSDVAFQGLLKSKNNDLRGIITRREDVLEYYNIR